MQATRDSRAPDAHETRRASRPSFGDGKGPLPQFGFPPPSAGAAPDDVEPLDPDKTLERLPAWGRARAASVSSEIDTVDILEEIPLRLPAWRPAPAGQEVEIREMFEGLPVRAPARPVTTRVDPGPRLSLPVPTVSRAAAPVPAPVAPRVPAALMAPSPFVAPALPPAGAPAAPPLASADDTGPRAVADSLPIDWEDAAIPARRRSRGLLVVGVVALLGVIGVAVMHRSESRAVASQGSRAAAPSKLPSPPPTPADATSGAGTPVEGAAGDVPMVSLDSLPRPSTGTVIGAPGHRLFVDGVVARGFSAVVRCGPHAVQVGSAGKLRTVDVPCGAEIYVR